MKVSVKYFAGIREVLGRSVEIVDTDAATLGALRDELIARGSPYAETLARGKAVRLAIQQVMADETACLHAGAEVAFFPPVTGG